MVVQHNILAANADRMQNISNKNLSTSVKKLSSGYKINEAGDDAAGLSISEKMRHQIRGLNQGADNIQEGIDYCQVADGALNEIQDMLQRMNELSIQAANGTNAETDREAIDQEIQQLKDEIQRICDTTKFNDEYIFKCEDWVEDADYCTVYELSFSGRPDDLYIYNETYDDATGTATYGGIAYNGKRYSWADISPNMYDSTTGMFHKGTYTLNAGGAYLNLVCNEGSEPPQVSRKFETLTNEKGIYVNGELISWDEVTSESGKKFDKSNILNEAYYFKYHGVTVSFTPELTDNYETLKQKLSGTRWLSTYKVPYEDTAIFANFFKSYSSFNSNDEVKNYLDKNVDFVENYILRAGDGTNGTFDGLWVERGGTVLAGSEMSWADMGITNWGDQSEDIWEDKTYTYTFQNDGINFSFEFNVVNEVSKDAAIDAFDGTNITEQQAIQVENHAEIVLDSQYSNVLSGTITRDTINLTLKEEYGLGRDYTKISDTVSQALQYDGTNFSVSYTNTVDGSTTDKNYSNTSQVTNNIVNNIKNQINAFIKNYLDDYVELVTARTLGGASDANEIYLPSLIGTENITGGGASTYLKDVVTLDLSNPALKSTQAITKTTSFAGASIDFSGLGTDYQLADLIGMGFNSTCHTCNNHYSIQFTTQGLTSTAWSSETVSGNNYQYSCVQQGSNYTLYIDVESMKNSISNGVDFTNAVVDIISDVKSSGSRFATHYSQYATYTDDAKLYVFDNRPNLVEDNTSKATNASFSPYAYGIGDTIADFTINMYDENSAAKGVGINYGYNFKDLFGLNNIVPVYSRDANGKYVWNPNTSSYEEYDDQNPDHANLTDRYNKTFSLDTQGQTLDQYLDDYIRTTIFGDISAASTITLVSDFARYYMSGQINTNKAMITEYNTPYQLSVPQKWKGKSNFDTEYLRIQCSSNKIDNIYIFRNRNCRYIDWV